MDWIERWFGVDPDGGDGRLELLLMLLAVAVIFAVVLMFNHRARAALQRWVAGIVPVVLRKR